MISEVGRHTQHNYAILDIVKFFKYLGIQLYNNGHMHRTNKKSKTNHTLRFIIYSSFLTKEN